MAEFSYINKTAQNEIGKRDTFSSQFYIDGISKKVEKIVKNSVLIESSQERVQLSGFVLWLI